MITASELAGRLNLRKAPRDWRGACPACGYAAAFRVRAGKDGAALAWCANCQDRDSVSNALAALLGGTHTPPPPSVDDAAGSRERKQAAAMRTWNGAGRLPGTLGERYLIQRGLRALSTSPTLRYRDDCSHPQGTRLAAIVAQVVDVDGKPVGVHRTYLDRITARKTTHDPAKASLGPVWHGAIRLHPIELGRPLVIGEGIESSASAGILFGAPAWAAISCGNLRLGLDLPPEVESIIIAADPDGVGRAAAETAARRWRRERRYVEIMIPNGEGDFNDVLLRSGGGRL